MKTQTEMNKQNRVKLRCQALIKQKSLGMQIVNLKVCCLALSSLSHSEKNI